MNQLLYENNVLQNHIVEKTSVFLGVKPRILIQQEIFLSPVQEIAYLFPAQVAVIEVIGDHDEKRAQVKGEKEDFGKIPWKTVDDKKNEKKHKAKFRPLFKRRDKGFEG
ncbi:MAG: hypothetical protein ACLUOC_00820 [Peptoniphilaceae bacterium]